MPAQQPEQHDMWMQLCQLNPWFNTASNSQGDDWAAAEIVRDSPNWISSPRRISNEATDSPWHRQLPVVDVSSLNIKQYSAYNMVLRHRTQFLVRVLHHYI